LQLIISANYCFYKLSKCTNDCHLKIVFVLFLIYLGLLLECIIANGNSNHPILTNWCFKRVVKMQSRRHFIGKVFSSFNAVNMRNHLSFFVILNVYTLHCWRRRASKVAIPQEARSFI